MENHSISWVVDTIIALVFDLMVLNVQALLMKRDSPISALSLDFGHFNPSLDVEMKEAKWVLECHSSPPGTGTLHEKNDFNLLKIKF